MPVENSYGPTFSGDPPALRSPGSAKYSKIRVGTNQARSQDFERGAYLRKTGSFKGFYKRGALH